MAAALAASAVVAFGTSPSAVLPPGATLDRAWSIPATASEPKQLLFEWHRRELVAPKGGRSSPFTVWRLVLMTGRSTAKHVVLGGPTSLNPVEELRIVDVTRDGHPDIVFHDVQGNHWCGPTRVVATIRARPRIVFAAEWCETSWSIRRGALHVDEPRGGQSVCCPSHRRLSVYRWNGRRLALVRSRLVRA